MASGKSGLLGSMAILTPRPKMTKREKAQLLAALYSLAHLIAGFIIMSALVLILPFLFAIR